MKEHSLPTGRKILTHVLSGLLAIGLLASCAAANRPGMTVVKQLPAQSDPTDQFNDEAVLAQMKARGSDLSKPTDIVFYLYIPSHADALASATELRRDGFQSEVHTPLGKLSDGTTETRWSVISHLTAAPSLETIHTAAAAMTRLAKRYSGDYDGWEAAVQK